MRHFTRAVLAPSCLIALSGAAEAQVVQYDDTITNASGQSVTGPQRVSASKPLPVTGSLSVGGLAQGSTTSGQSGSLTMCATTTAAPTYTNATTNPCNTDTSGQTRVADAALLAAAQASTPAGSAIIGKVGVDQTTPGTTNAVQPIPGTSGGLTMFYLTAANSTNATNVKASAGQLYRADLSNNSATPAYVSFYNTSGTPTCGTSIVYQMMIPANSTSGAGWVSAGSMGLTFSSGIGICATTGIAGTGAVAASAYTISLGYK